MVQNGFRPSICYVCFFKVLFNLLVHLILILGVLFPYELQLFDLQGRA